MECTTDINLGGFGNSARMTWQTVKSWDSFTDFFEDAVHIDAVTYCESPELLLDLFEQQEAKLESMDVLVGNRDEYRSSVNDVTVARQLERYYREEKLIVRLKNRNMREVPVGEPYSLSFQPISSAVTSCSRRKRRFRSTGHESPYRLAYFIRVVSSEDASGAEPLCSRCFSGEVSRDCVFCSSLGTQTSTSSSGLTVGILPCRSCTVP